MFADLKDKRVLITGASGGLGSAIARLFAAHGSKLGLQYRQNAPAIDALAKELGAMTKVVALRADLLDVAAARRVVEEFVASFGGVDVLINGAGAAHDYAPFSELSEKALTDSFALNAIAPFYLIAGAFKHMEAQGSGRIINISSVNVKYGGSAKSMHYAAAKAALESLSRGFARAGAAHGILVNTIRPGFIDTPMRTKVAGYREEDALRRVNLIPLRRMGTPDDIARMALFLASDAGNFITGETFTVAGGD